MLPSLSIIIPVYKVEPYLRECLDSVAASPLDCWEAILIDDGSPDGCPQICDEYDARDNRFRVIHQENAGVAAARNAGLDAAKGEWIWFVDSDDVVDMRPVESIIEWLKANENEIAELHNNDKKVNVPVSVDVNTPVDLVMFDLETIDGNWNDNANLNPNENYNEKVKVEKDVSVEKNKFLLQHVVFHHQRLWYRRDIIERFNIRFTMGVRLAEDLELMYKYMTLCQHPVKINTTLYYYREREGSATQNSTYRMKAVEDLQIVLNNLAEWIRKYNIHPEPWLDFRIKMLFQNLLYSGSVVKILDVKRFQTDVRNIIAAYRRLHFSFVKNVKYRLAEWNIQSYFVLNGLYLKLFLRK